MINTINYDSGATIRDGIKACSMYGCCSENLYPHIIKIFTKAVSYKYIINFYYMKKSFINKNPIIICFIVYSIFNIMFLPINNKNNVF